MISLIYMKIYFSAAYFFLEIFDFGLSPYIFIFHRFVNFISKQTSERTWIYMHTHTHTHTHTHIYTCIYIYICQRPISDSGQSEIRLGQCRIINFFIIKSSYFYTPVLKTNDYLNVV